MTCQDCKDTGFYVGLTVREPCKACNPTVFCADCEAHLYGQECTHKAGCHTGAPEHAAAEDTKPIVFTVADFEFNGWVGGPGVMWPIDETGAEFD